MKFLWYKKQQYGFTLVELLVVIVLLSVLALIGLPTFVGSQKRSRDNKRKTDLAQVAKVLEMYANDAGRYPCSNNGVMTNCLTTTYNWGESFSNGTTIYMQKLPKDPSAKSYYYQVPDSVGKKYLLWARLERTDDSDLLPASATTITTGTSTSSIVTIPQCGMERCNYVLRSSSVVIQ